MDRNVSITASVSRGALSVRLPVDTRFLLFILLYVLLLHQRNKKIIITKIVTFLKWTTLTVTFFHMYFIFYFILFFFILFFFLNCYYVQMLHKCNLWQDVTRLNGSVLTLTISTSLLKASCMFSWTFWCVLTFLGASQGFIWQEIWRELTAERATGRSWTRAAAARTQSVHGGRMLKLLSHCFRFLPG